MQSQSRRRLGPIVKKILMAVAIKKGFDMFQEKRRRKSSWLGRAVKLGMWSAGGGGIFYAFISGKLRPLVDKLMGGSSSPSGHENWSSPARSTSSDLTSSPVMDDRGSSAGSSASSTSSSFNSSLQSSEAPRA